MRALPKEQNTALMREAVSGLVHLEVWKHNGDSFEFAQFTDREIAKAIDSCDQRSRRPALGRLTSLVAETRRRQDR